MTSCTLHAPHGTRDHGRLPQTVKNTHLLVDGSVTVIYKVTSVMCRLVDRAVTVMYKATRTMCIHTSHASVKHNKPHNLFCHKTSLN